MKLRKINLKTMVAAAVLAGTIPLAIAASITSDSFSATYRMRVGTGNTVNDVVRSMAVGLGNVMGSAQSTRYHALAVGRYLTVDDDYSVVVGEHNDSVTGGAYFVVGNGSAVGQGQEGNLLEVRRDGQIIVTAPQGDIPVGIYE